MQTLYDDDDDDDDHVIIYDKSCFHLKYKPTFYLYITLVLLIKCMFCISG